ncbi:4-alpha-glucanotransferase [Thalassotalea ponticola]|uniref:4-alpha-glucanotransferase n=1 Tax=Thalassotalea ponticola TaxID=1523392 RepID=UPI0025B306E9|nr:4-alpha-glucanotransferase [Thalassotalea ponticola]MDN3652502.1 4-alpha-glucanotransferase [Thalassotalea ponticola]
MTPMQQLAEQVGFHPSYKDCYHNTVYANQDALKALLEAMDYDLSSEHAILSAAERLQHGEWQKLLADTCIVKAELSQYSVPVSVRISDKDQPLTWQLALENGQTLTGSADLHHLAISGEGNVGEVHYQKLELLLPHIEQGYHQLTVTVAEHTERCHLIVAPKTCLSPNEVANYRMWGLAAQLYSLKSDNSWGMGDFGDLKTLVTQSAERGVTAIGLNPLHPLYPNNPGHISPYSPTSRCFLNTMYIDVTSVDNFTDCEAAQALVNSADFQHHVSEANNKEFIDYPYAAHLKYQVLELLYQDFTANHLASNSDFAKAYQQFVDEMGDDLFELATFDALYEHFRNIDEHAYGWKAWPKAYQDPHSDEVEAFKKDHAERIGYFQFLQFVADRQLAAAANEAKAHQMPIGLYMDLAVGCDGSGAEVWADKHSYVAGAAVGAPPDAMNTLGQDWGLTPINPVALKQKGYMPLVKALRSNMRHAGALRIDHVLGLMRQYWVAPGMAADQGIYITFPLEDIFRIIALESRRNRCVVIGEDLGNVPDGFGDIMAEYGLLSYKVLFFERWDTGLYFRPELYPEQSMVTVSTHDLSTLAGWWTGNDLKWRQDLNLYPNEQMGIDERAGRVTDREQLLAALEFEGVLKREEFPSTQPAQMNHALSRAAQAYLAKAPSRVLLVPVEDALGLHEQVNIPGTVDEHPNWRRRLPLPIDQFWLDTDMKNLVDVMNLERPKGE